jgi:hypothetical protein
MKSAISAGHLKGLVAELDGLHLLDLEELNGRWRSLFGSDPPDRLRRSIQALAYRIQEQTLCGLKPATRHLLKRIAGEAADRRPVAVDLKPQIKAGAVLIREWHGIRHQVTALKDGFMFRGQRFGSLSKVASEITGSRWSGPLFFGLKPSRQENQDGAR